MGQNSQPLTGNGDVSMQMSEKFSSGTTSPQTNKQTNKQTNQQTNQQTNKQINQTMLFWRKFLNVVNVFSFFRHVIISSCKRT